jgi:hypothetical protein
VAVSFIGRENHWPVASHSQTLSHNVVHLTLIEIRTHNISGDLITFMFMFALYEFIFFSQKIKKYSRGCHGNDLMVVGFTTTYAISAYHHWCCEFESRSGWGVQHYVIKFVSDLRQVSLPCNDCTLCHYINITCSLY